MRPRLIRGAALALAATGGAAALAGCGSGVDSGGLTRADFNAAQNVLNTLQTSNIPGQLIAETATAGQSPVACRVHLESTSPSTFKVYVFWVPYIGPQSYTWIDMTVTNDSTKDKFHYGTQQAVASGGTQLSNGQTVVPPLNDYDTPLSQYGSAQAQKDEHVLMAHAGDTFSKPGANCQVLENGYLRVIPNK